MQTFTIDKAYNCLYWQTAVVRAETLEQAIEEALAADGLMGPEERVALDGDEAGVIACDEWTCDGGWGACGPTWITEIATGTVHADLNELPGRAYLLEADRSRMVPVPPEHSHFATEWPEKAAEIARLREAVSALLPYAESRYEDLDQHRAAGNEDPNYPGAEACGKAIAFAQSVLAGGAA